MKKLAIILSITAVISLTAFLISVAVLGTNNSDLSGSHMIYFSDGETVIKDEYEEGKVYSMEYSGDISSLSLDVTSADFTVTCSQTDKATVKYTAHDRTSFSSVYENGKLSLKQEKKVTLGFDLGGSRSSVIEITLPEKTYDEAVLNMMSGDGRIKGLTAKSFISSAMSGNCDYEIYAENITISSMSGEAKLSNCTDMTAKKIIISSMSGNRDISFIADEWDIESSSGDIRVSGIGGNVNANTSSGALTLDYTEWNGDLYIESMSGDIDITLPAGSSAELDYDTMSGDLKTDIGGQKGKYSGDVQETLGSGSNLHNADINTSSGDLEITIRQ